MFLRVGRVAPFRFLVQHPEKSFRAGHRHQCLIQLIADGLHRIEKKIREKKKHHEVADFHVQPAVPAQRAERAEQRHRAEEKLALQLQQRHEHRRRLRDADVVFAMHINQFLKKSRVDFVAHERLRHADAAHGFGERRGDAAPRFLDLAHAAASFPAGNVCSRTR